MGYSLLLLAHVASAVVGFGALGVTGVQAARACHGPTGPHAVAARRYFRPGVNWSARVLYLVPVFGFALLVDSGRAFDVSDAFVLSGLGMWLVAAAMAEALVWPAERRIQRIVTHDWRLGEPLRRDCARVVSATWFLAFIFVSAVVVMVAKP
jgi:hypothetical protein